MRSIVAILVFLLLSVPLSSGYAEEPFHILDESCVYYPGAQKYVFEITLSIAPDFCTVEERPWGSHQKHNFVYQIDFVDNTMWTLDITRIIRASDACNTDMITIYDAIHEPPWYVELGKVKYHFNAHHNTLRFTVPAELMGGQGVMHYILVTKVFGSIWDGNGVSGDAVVKGPKKGKGGPLLAEEHGNVERSTWGRIKAVYRTN